MAKMYYCLELDLLLDSVVFDEAGELVSGWVVNGAWFLKRNLAGNWCAWYGVDASVWVTEMCDVPRLTLKETRYSQDYNSVMREQKGVV